MLAFIFPIAFMFYEFQTFKEVQGIIIGLAIVLLGWSYYLFVVYRVHQIIQIRYDNQYDVSPNKAAFNHLIPFYNVFWLYKWSSSLFSFIEQKEKRVIAKKYAVIGSLMIGPPISRFDSAIGLAFTAYGLMILIREINQLDQPQKIIVVSENKIKDQLEYVCSACGADTVFGQKQCTNCGEVFD